MNLQNNALKDTLLFVIMLSFFLITSCKDDVKKDQQFELMSPSQTGLDFSNNLTYDSDLNVYKYRNFYNGGGVAIGDVNNDGLVDVYFTANQTKNKLYINKGNFKFEDITEKSGTGGNHTWSTGVTMVDINGDGFLDIYVCNSGNKKEDNKKNELFINNGDLTFTESAEKYNLADKGYSIIASFFDYDKDGDLDLYLLNNSFQAIGSFNQSNNGRDDRDLLGGDRLLENRNGKFFDVSEKAGIYGSIIGFGLGVSIGDVNRDNWDDIYVSNDFFERDYLYINQKDGTFKECLTDQIMSITAAAMGGEMVDINNDGWNEIYVTDMFPSDYKRLKMVTTFEDYDSYRNNLKNDYYHQFTRNTLQKNNGNNTFSEIGRYSGIEATDWSWGALFFDMNNNGLKDLCISNGVYKDLTNQDYLRYISSPEVIKAMVSDKNFDYHKLIKIIPSNKVENQVYKNLGNFNFKRDYSTGLNLLSFSNGAAYGDLDNDGDLDLIVNNVNTPCFLFKNNLINTNTNSKANSNYIKLIVQGEDLNNNAIGAKIKVSSKKGDNYYYEIQPTRGFQSCMDNRPNIGVGSNDTINIKVIWPKGNVTILKNIPTNQTITINEKNTAKPQKNIKKEVLKKLFVKNTSKIAFKHHENVFSDFNKNRLINQMYSSLGPKASMADVDKDGYNDLFIGGSKGFSSVLLKGSAGKFIKQKTPAFEKNKNSEDLGSLFFDADNDGDLDLYVCSGGMEFSSYSKELSDRLYFNNGKGKFTISPQKLPTNKGNFSTGTVIASDIDNDGDLDLFIGERLKPDKYGMLCSGFILLNNGKGIFEDVTETYAPELKNIGMITDAIFNDFDKDGDDDLLVVGEFMGVKLFKNNNGSFQKLKDNPLENLKGWWNTIGQADLDNDGDMDIIIGNNGLNSRFKASVTNPISLYVKDFDLNGSIDPVYTFRGKDGKDYPYALRHNLIAQIKNLKKRFPDYMSFESADISKIFSKKELEGATKLVANRLQTTLLINQGNFKFDIAELPQEVQYSPVYAFEFQDFDKDGDTDIVFGGNLYKVKPEFGRYDASYGGYLENEGNMKFKFLNNDKSFLLKGEIRDMIVNKNELIVLRNNDSIAVFNF